MDTNTQRPLSRKIRLPEVERVTGLRRSAIYKRIAAGEFPQPLRLSSRCSVWCENEIRTWIEAIPRVRGRPKVAHSDATRLPMPLSATQVEG